MNKIFKNTLTFFLCVLMLFGSVLPGFFGFSASAKTINDCDRGEIVTFGWYPQTKVTDSAIVDTLNKQSVSWNSYEYYIGMGKYDGNMAPSGYMKYTDVTIGSQKYRGVQFSQYRPFNTGLISSSNSSYQDENGYDQPGNTYWFAWEPLQWRVLDPSTGLMMCDMIIDSQPFNNFVLASGTDEYDNNAYWGDAGKAHYANNYAQSSLRRWLTEDFYNTAFSASQQNIIVPSTLDNTACDPSYSAYDSTSTTDKVYALSFSDIMNTEYDFNADNWSSDVARQAQGSDYAKCQGLYVDTSDGYSRWWLRSAGYYSDRACGVEYDGTVCDYYYYHASLTDFGIRPALRLNLTSEIIQPDVGEIGVDALESIVLKTNPTKMSYHVGDMLDASGLSLTATYNSGNTETISSGFTCTPTALNSAGTQTITVIYQDKTTSFSVTVSNEHDYEYEITTKPGCETEGEKIGICKLCGDKKTQAIPALGHSYEKTVTAAAGAKCGYTTHTCVRCSDTFIDSYTAPTGKLGGFKCKARTAAAQTVIWNNVKTATGYQVQISTKDGNKWSTYAALKAGVTSYTFKNLAAGNAYKFRVRFYITAPDGKKYFSPWSSTLTSPTLPTGTSLTKLTAGRKAFTAQWKKNNAVNGYQLQYSTNAKFTGAKTVTLKSNKTLKTTVKKLSAKKVYYVRVRTYKTISKVNYFSTWSKNYKVKTK